MGAEFGIIGVNKIELGNCGTNGLMGTTLTEITDIVTDSVNLVFDEPGKTDLTVENLVTPWASIPDPLRAKRIEFSSRNVDPAMLVKAFNGTTVNSTRWEESTVATIIEQSVKITSSTIAGYKRIIYIPKSVIRASFDGKLQSKDSSAIKFVCDINAPVNSGGTVLPGIYIDKVAG